MVSRWAFTASVLAAVGWFSWMFRYEQVSGSPWFFLDRWTGQLVIADGKDFERIPLTAPRELSDAEVFGAPRAPLGPSVSGYNGNDGNHGTRQDQRIKRK